MKTQFVNGVNPWAQLFEQHVPRHRYNWDYLPAGKRLYMAKEQARQASKVLAQYLKRRGIKGRAHSTTLGRPCVWWEVEP